MLVYPHRISSFEKTKCDICKIKFSKNLLLLDSVPFKGLQYCDNIICKNTGELWLNSCTIPQDILEQKYGFTISIVRNNNLRETGWKISSPAFQTELKGKYWVKITNKTNIKSKFITLDLLCEWNPIFDNSPITSPGSNSSRKSFSDISIDTDTDNI